jgi:hypothetical protein
MVEFTHTTLFLLFSTYKGSSLVVEAHTKPCQESRVESSLCSSTGSSLRDRWALVSLPFFIDFELEFLYVLFLFCLELRCMHSYYHLVPLVCWYCSVGYLSDSVNYSSSSYLECFTDISVFPCILSADGETFDSSHRCGVRVSILQWSSTPCTEVWYRSSDSPHTAL